MAGINGFTPTWSNNNYGGLLEWAQRNRANQLMHQGNNAYLNNRGFYNNPSNTATPTTVTAPVSSVPAVAASSGLLGVNATVPPVTSNMSTNTSSPFGMTTFSATNTGGDVPYSPYQTFADYNTIPSGMSAETLSNYTQQLGYNPANSYEAGLMNAGEKKPFNWSGLASGIADLTNAGAGVGQLILGYKNYQQAKKQFEFEKGLLNRNVKNQTTQINNQMDAATNIAAQLNRKAGMTSADYQAARDKMYDDTKKRHVDGTPVG